MVVDRYDLILFCMRRLYIVPGHYVLFFPGTSFVVVVFMEVFLGQMLLLHYGYSWNLLSFLSSPQPVHRDLLKMKWKVVPGFTQLIAVIPVQGCLCPLQRFIGIPCPACLFLLPCIFISTSSDLWLAISLQLDTKGENAFHHPCWSMC